MDYYLVDIIFQISGSRFKHMPKMPGPPMTSDMCTLAE